MTKLGASIAVLIVLALLGFASMVKVRSPMIATSPPVALPIDPPSAVTLALPVAGVSANALADTWGDSRAGGSRVHQAIDIAAPGGTPVIAAAPGRVEKMFRSAAGGTTLYVRSPDSRTSYYYAHLAGYAPGMREGLAVKTGTLLGFVGDTGNAGAGNTHLHFAVSRMGSTDRWWEGEPLDPYPMLAGRRAVR